MIAAALLLLAPLQEPRLVPAQVRVRGPLEGVTLDCGKRGRVEVNLSLLEGETRTLKVPMPGRPMDDAAPHIEAAVGEVEFLGYLQPDGGAGTFPPALYRRPRPTLSPGVSVVDPVALLLLAAGATAVLASRRRGWTAALLGLGCAGLVVAAQVRQAQPSSGLVRVLEGDAADGAVDGQVAWMLVEGAAGALAFDLEGDAAIEVDPEGAPLNYVGDGQGRWSVQGQRLWRRATLEPGGRRVDGQMNLWGSLEQVWIRTSQGIWTGRGEWPMGSQLPAGGVDGQPPGWLAAGIPPGRDALVARLAPGAWAGLPGPGQEPDVVWLRLVGFDFAGAR